MLDCGASAEAGSGAPGRRSITEQAARQQIFGSTCPKPGSERRGIVPDTYKGWGGVLAARGGKGRFWGRNGSAWHSPGTHDPQIQGITAGREPPQGRNSSSGRGSRRSRRARRSRSRSPSSSSGTSSCGLVWCFAARSSRRLAPQDSGAAATADAQPAPPRRQPSPARPGRPAPGRADRVGLGQLSGRCSWS